MLSEYLDWCAMLRTLASDAAAIAVVARQTFATIDATYTWLAPTLSSNWVTRLSNGAGNVTATLHATKGNVAVARLKIQVIITGQINSEAYTRVLNHNA